MIAKIRRHTDRSPLATVLLLSGCMGFCLGLSNATWQVTAESGQVLAGIVKYPPDNPFYVYHIKLLTIINQISALLLILLNSERVISILISGLLGMVSFQAVAVLIFAINGNRIVALLGVLLIYFANYVGDGAIYPIWLLGQPHTYGILGLSFTILTIALLGAKAYRAGLFCLAMAPCVHPSLGMWLVIIVAISAALQWNFAKSTFRAFYPYFIAGAVVALASLAYQLNLMADLPNVAPDDKKMYFDAFVKYWGSHQQKLYWGYAQSSGFRRWGVVFCIYSVIACGLSRRLLKRKDSLRLMFTIIMVCGIGSLTLGFLTQLPAQTIPSFLLMFMPGRYLNLNNVTLAALLLGVLSLGRNKPYVTNYNAFVAFLVGALLARHCEAQTLIFAVILCWLGHFVLRVEPSPAKSRLAAIREHKVGYELLLAFFLITLLLINMPRRKFIDRFLANPHQLTDRTNNEFYSAVAQRKGLLLITHYASLTSLKTRRPILADVSSPNTITYAPESGPALNNILKEIYDVDLLVPPPPEYRHKEIPPELYKNLWQDRPVAQWRRIRAQFHVTDILTPGDWRLQLPVAAHGQGMILYEIPEQ